MRPNRPTIRQRYQSPYENPSRTPEFSSGAGWRDFNSRKAVMPAPSAATAGSAVLLARQRHPLAHLPLISLFAIGRVQSIGHALGHLGVFGRRDEDLQFAKVLGAARVEGRRD